MQEQIELANKELRGKKFTLDRFGKPVVVGVISAEKLPPFSMPLSLNIKSTTGGDYNGGGVLDTDDQSTGSNGVGRKQDHNNNLHRSNNNNNNNDNLDNNKNNLSPGGAATASGAKTGKKKPFVRVAGSRGVDENSFKPTLSLAVTLSGVDHIPRLNPGRYCLTINDNSFFSNIDLYTLYCFIIYRFMYFLLLYYVDCVIN